MLNHTADRQADDADATVTLSRDTLNEIILERDQARGRDRLRRRQGQRRPGEAGGGGLLPRHLRVLVQHRHAERDQLTETSEAGALIGHLPGSAKGLDDETAG